MDPDQSAQSDRSGLELHVNGVPAYVEPAPDELLVDTVRDRLGLKGTKLGCGTGDCGACTVLLDGEPVCSCIVFTRQCVGRRVTTVEQIATTRVGAATAAALGETGGLQCGICTPGIVVSAAALLESDGPVDRTRIKDALAGNLCRCTGYTTITDAICRARVQLSGEAGDDDHRD